MRVYQFNLVFIFYSKKCKERAQFQKTQYDHGLRSLKKNLALSFYARTLVCFFFFRGRQTKLTFFQTHAELFSAHLIFCPE